jgi:hypothetical protein
MEGTMDNSMDGSGKQFPSMHPAPELRRGFARLARNYVAACDVFTMAIQAADAAGVGDAQTQAAKLYANANRGRAYGALLDGAVALARAKGRGPQFAGGERA